LIAPSSGVARVIFLTLLAFSNFVYFPQVLAKTHRDPHERAAFMRQHPCPSTGKTRGACPGYVVDHVIPLCAGGPDRPSNMQWQTRSDAKVKDQEERKMCRGTAETR
jgi:hypothetical protein